MFKMLLFHDIADPEGRASRKLSLKESKDCRDVKGQENVSDRIKQDNESLSPGYGERLKN
jgi:hypothetical protein